jgi:two-component system OmpR family response regulator
MDRMQLKTILYVDDEADIREIVQMALGIDKDLIVHTCESGERALAQMLNLRPDLLLLDVMMSGMDGPTTLSRMREYPALANIPVIFMTAKALPREVARFREMGAIGVIGKPFDPMKLSQQVLAMWTKAPHTGPTRDNPALQSRLDQLSGEFLQRTLEDLAALRARLGSTAAAEGATLKQVERLAHRIRGAGAALGFEAVSACAGEIERLAEEHSREAAPSGSDVTRQLTRHTERLGAMVEELVQGTPSK